PSFPLLQRPRFGSYAAFNSGGPDVMRTVLASLILAAGFAAAAQAQTPAPAAPAAEAPPAAPAAPPARPAAPPAEAPALPTSGDGAQVIQALEKVCVPLVRGQTLEQIGKGAGL